MAADILVITPVIQTARPEHQRQTTAVAAVRPRTDVGQRLVIILMRPVAHLTVTKPDVLAGLIPVPMVAEAQENVVLLVPILNRLHRRLLVIVAAQEEEAAVDAPDTNPVNQNSLKLKTKDTAKNITHRITEETAPLKLEGHA